MLVSLDYICSLKEPCHSIFLQTVFWHQNNQWQALRNQQTKTLALSWREILKSRKETVLTQRHKHKKSGISVGPVPRPSLIWSKNKPSTNMKMKCMHIKILFQENIIYLYCSNFIAKLILLIMNTYSLLPRH